MTYIFNTSKWCCTTIFMEGYKIGFLNFIILKNDFIPNKNYGWRDKLKKRRRLLINVTHAST